MSIHELIAVHILHLADDIRHPLKLLLSTRHPQKVHLLAWESEVGNLGFVDDVF